MVDHERGVREEGDMVDHEGEGDMVDHERGVREEGDMADHEGEGDMVDHEGGVREEGDMVDHEGVCCVACVCSCGSNVTFKLNV